MLAELALSATAVARQSCFLKMFSAKDVFESRRGFARLLDLPFDRQEVTINIGFAAALYKNLITSTEGYVGDVPIIHQAVAMKAAIDAIDTAFAEDRDRGASVH